ncbi:MAG: Gfo/Idh/MocA family oxidoreductase [Chloroflexi bacterium]|nr:Gfo/Idh/MocA family oxidoreductase [Bacteroidota bacterium]MCL5110983.1 Gfo/Idh/MocA family oxidoreductase [Chloroflexota bacterium]
MDPVRIGFIGCGRHASLNRLPCVFYAPVELVGLCDLVEERARNLGLKIGCGHVYTDHQRLLADDRLEAVVVAVRPEAFLRVVRDALAAGKHVFMEKPPGDTLEESREMASLTEKSGLVVQVGFNKRFAPAYRRARAIVREGGLGEVSHYSGKFSTGRFPPSPGGWQFLREQAIHQLDLVRYLMGEVAELTALRNSAGGLETYDALLRFASGAIGVLTSGEHYSWNKPNERVEIAGQGRWLAIDDVIHLTEHPAIPLGTEPVSGDEPSLLWEPTFAMPGARSLLLQGYAYELAAFAEAVRGQRQEGASYIEDAWKSMQLARAVHESNGRTVRPADF